MECWNKSLFFGFYLPDFQSCLIFWKEITDFFVVLSGGGRSFIQIQNDDDLCLARAVVVAKARIDKETDQSVKWGCIRQNEKTRNYLQRDMARQLMADCGLGDHGGPCGIAEFKQIQSFLAPNYQLKIFSQSVCDNLIFVGEVDNLGKGTFVLALQCFEKYWQNFYICEFQILEIYMVYHYEKWDQHDGKDENTGLFARYMNHFMKGKIEATGYPSGIEVCLGKLHDTLCTF